MKTADRMRHAVARRKYEEQKARVEAAHEEFEALVERLEKKLKHER